ncbi:MAG: hypothetical protein DHS20C18_52610 [Saprospiraceae bacterium]|nr:MAG: hypothetical protein DHS20C18_52610 [Saprospiraceae bacterium]
MTEKALSLVTKSEYMRIITLLLFLFSSQLTAQKVLQIETYGKANTKKIFIGQEIDYLLKETDIWHNAVIEDLRIDRNLVVLGDRYVALEDIGAFRTPHNWSRPVGNQLMLFGLTWSGYALIGKLTDGRSETNYGWGDAIVTGTAGLVGLLLPKIFRYKTTKFGKRKRLRMIDITF